ncbi:MAG: hypothetical protein RSD62_07275, partial [Ruthenibacterium sp.]
MFAVAVSPVPEGMRRRTLSFFELYFELYFDLHLRGFILIFALLIVTKQTNKPRCTPNKWRYSAVFAWLPLSDLNG